MRQIGIALHTAQDAYSAMPASGQVYTWPAGIQAPTTNFTGSVHFWLLPFIDQGNMMQWWSVSNPTWTTSGNDETSVNVRPPKLYLCPSDPSGVSSTGMVGGVATTEYVANAQVFGIGSPKVPGTFPDGSATTGLFYERYARCQGNTTSTPTNPNGTTTSGKGYWDWGGDIYIRWTRANATEAHSPVCYFGMPQAGDGRCTNDGLTASIPSLINPFMKFQAQPPLTSCIPTTTQSMHSPGMNVLMGDASVKLVAPSVTATTWHASITPNSKDVVGPDW
jgi:hypothetical protein